MVSQVIKITFEELDNYSKYKRENPQERISLNEYIKLSRELDVEVIADLSAIQLDQPINLTNCDLSGTILDGLEFSGEHVVIKGADLRGASLKNVRFTNYINLSGTKLGSVSLSKEMFKLCQLKDADYVPYESQEMLVDVTDQQLEDYLRSTETNLNQYLTNLLSDKYPKGTRIIADLSGRTIDGEFSGKDLSGTNLRGVIITGEIHNLELRDCYTNETIFSDCTLIRPDLRGTYLVVPRGDTKFKATIFEGEVLFQEPKMSIGIDDPQLLYEKGILPTMLTEDLLQPDFKGHEGIVLDPCYVRCSNSQDIKKSIRCTRKDLEDYVAYRLRTKVSAIEDFCTWKGIKSNEIADFSSLDLTNIKNLKGASDGDEAVFKNCNFAFANFSGTDLKYARFENCNLSGARFSEDSLGLVERYEDWFAWLPNVIRPQVSKSEQKANLEYTKFKDCNLNTANLTKVNAQNAVFENIEALNLDAKGLDLRGAKLSGNSNVSGSDFERLKAQSIKANGSCWSYAYCRNADFSNADLSQVDFSNADLTGDKLENTTLFRVYFKNSKLDKADLTDAKLEKARVDGSLGNSILVRTSLDNADFQVLVDNFKNVEGV
ncbi:MAG: pentapeptide repeat-containing protein, partial [Pseudomonadota bacterium]